MSLMKHEPNCSPTPFHLPFVYSKVMQINFRAGGEVRERRLSPFVLSLLYKRPLDRQFHLLKGIQ